MRKESKAAIGTFVTVAAGILSTLGTWNLTHDQFDTFAVALVSIAAALGAVIVSILETS